MALVRPSRRNRPDWHANWVSPLAALTAPDELLTEIVDQILGPPKAPATTIYLTVGPFGLSRKVTATILTDAPAE